MTSAARVAAPARRGSTKSAELPKSFAEKQRMRHRLTYMRDPTR
jgi:hypothetical protein